MPTFMTEHTFARLKESRDAMSTIPDGPSAPSNIFVPWAGERLVSEGRGVYFVGMAVAAEPADGDQDFATRLKATEAWCRDPKRPGSPYWQFINRITSALLGGAYDQTQHAWGWSNLLKIAGKEGSPSDWGRDLVPAQRDAGVDALREEISALRDSLVIITSGQEFGVIYSVLPKLKNWDTVNRPGCTYFLHDPDSGNAIVHSYHPKYMQMKRHFDSAVEETIYFAKTKLKPFPSAV